MSFKKLLFLGWSFFILSTMALAAWGMSNYHWQFSYALDDAYIHLTLAKNLAFYGTWGMHPGEFSSSSSSLLWTVLLASLMKIFGPTTVLPMCTSLISGFVLIYFYVKIAVKLPTKFAQIGWLIGLLLISPLSQLVLIGMEHLLQTLLFLIFFGVAIDWFKSNRFNKFYLLLLLAPLVATIRYEGLFLIAGCCFLYFMERNWAKGLLLGLIAIVPILLFGLWSIKQGGFFFPNSLMMKTDAGLISNPYLFLKNLCLKIHNLSPLLWAIILFNTAVICFMQTTNAARSSLRKGSFVLLTTTVFHAFFARTGHLFRFEAALVTLAWAHGLSLFFYYFNSTKMVIEKARIGFFLSVISIPFLIRAQYIIRGSRISIKNVRQHHYVMNEFLKKHYSDKLFALHDIGIVGFYNPSKFIDLAGLGSTDFIDSGARTNRDSMENYCRNKGISIGLLYPEWMENTIPFGWVKVATWHYPKPVSCCDLLVFFAIDSTETGALRNHLIEFTSTRPEILMELEKQ